MGERVVGVRVPLTEKQREVIAAAGGSVSEVVVVGQTDGERVENEVSSGFDYALVHAMWNENEGYLRALQADKTAARSEFAYGTEREPATLAYLRSTAFPRVVGLRVPLSIEQRKAVRASSGADVTEVVVIGQTHSSEPLRNEVATGIDAAAIHAFAGQGAKFAEAVEADPKARQSEWYVEGSDDRPPPTLGAVR